MGTQVGKKRTYKPEYVFLDGSIQPTKENGSSSLYAFSDRDGQCFIRIMNVGRNKGQCVTKERLLEAARTYQNTNLTKMRNVNKNCFENYKSFLVKKDDRYVTIVDREING